MRRGTPTPQDVAGDLWSEHQLDLELLQFSEDFVERYNQGELLDLPSGDVEVGEAMFGGDGILQAGTLRIGGRDGEVLDVGSVPRARYLEALTHCHHSGRVRLPKDEVCKEVVDSFKQYRAELRSRLEGLAGRRTTDQRRLMAIGDALMSNALQ